MRVRAACLAAFTPPAMHLPIVLVNAVVMAALIVTGYMGFFRLSQLVRVFALGGLLWVAFRAGDRSWKSKR